MGATLPVLARYAVAEEAQIGRRIGLLYAMNTAGAVAGALLAAFLLLPELGLTRTVWIAAALNAIVFLLAVALARRMPHEKRARGYSDDAKSRPALPGRIRKYSFKAFPGPAWVLPLMLLAGAVAFFQEVLWTRMLAHVVGSSIYAFGVMVASFLAGIALGGALGAAIAKTRERATLALGVALVVAAVAAAVAYLRLETVLPSTAGLLVSSDIHFGFLHVPNTLFCGILLLPMTLAIGMTYPLAVRILASDAEEAAPVSARVYSWNTVGAIAGRWPRDSADPELNTRVHSGRRLRQRAGVAASGCCARESRGAIATSVLASPAASFQSAGADDAAGDLAAQRRQQHRVLYYDIGRSASVVILAQDGGLGLRTNGLPEALMDSPGSRSDSAASSGCHRSR
jgi:spermidine synthase